VHAGAGAAALCCARGSHRAGRRRASADGRAAEWQSALYEELHAATIALHERIGAPYRYLEWREALALVTGQ
jgi:hypothetical protein